ncbi:ABC transporter substrate-binding protein [Paenibacillus silviterrae]|uniref:ABC transporter substrate-binding protein n=1 Tax=Paenibacillus silviterrae TaxID=3242194 RepID=UPI002543D9FE|nr:extracellular solute-binding protein [Paenibacillus chinjuensis]
MIKKVSTGMAALTAFALLLTACTGMQQAKTKPEEPPAVVSNEPAEVSIYLWTMPQAEFDFIAEQAKTKFPHITLKAIPNTNAGGPSLDAMVTAGALPDLFAARGVATQELVKRGLLYDVSDLMKKHKFDSSRLDPLALEQMKNETGGIIAGVPLSGTTGGILHYNKDLFDRFGVPYPKDGMTWDEIYEISKLMTRNEDGVQYRGLAERWMDTFFAMNPYGETYLSLTEDKANVNTEGWKRIAENFARFYTIPGLKFDAKTINKEQDWRVFIEGRAAMSVFSSRNFMNWNFRWDIVSLPTYKDKPGIGRPADFRNLYVMSSSKNKDAAFQIASWLTSDDMQSKLAADFGVFPVVTSDAVRKNFQKNDPLYKDKNIAAHFVNKVGPGAPGRKAGLVNVDAQTPLMKELEKVIVEGKDLNSALRAAEEAINRAITTEKSK